MAKAARSSPARHVAVRSVRGGRSSKKRTLVFALGALEHDVEQLPKEFEYVISPGKHLWLSYLRGIVYGLGAITAAVFVIPFIIWVLQKIPWVPIIGNFAQRVAVQMERSAYVPGRSAGSVSE